MIEPVSWAGLGQAALGAITGRLAERGVDWVLDRRQRTSPPEPPKRHRLDDVTSDVDIVVRHRHGGGNRVLLAFRTAPREGRESRPVTMPMLAGETAHLTLPRDDYLIIALVVDPPPDLGGKPVLHGIGRARSWVASTTTVQVAITTELPSAKQLRKLGLQAPDGTSAFEIAPKPAPRVPPPATQPGAWAAMDAHLAARAAQRNAASSGKPQCRARIGQLGPRCTDSASPLSPDGFCPKHDRERRQGRTVREWPIG